MDSVGLANTFVAMNQAQTSQAIQTEFVKMAAQQDANLVALLQQGAENAQATPAPGLGARVDVTA